jgi:hypothetical protein
MKLKLYRQQGVAGQTVVIEHRNGVVLKAADGTVVKAKTEEQARARLRGEPVDESGTDPVEPEPPPPPPPPTKKRAKKS